MRFISKYRKSDHFSHLNVFEHTRKLKSTRPRRKTNGSAGDNSEECCYGRSLSSVTTTTSYGSGRNNRSPDSTNGIGNYAYEDDDDDDEESRIRIKFTRKFTYQYKNFCCVLSSLLLSLLSAAVVFYIGYNYIRVEPGEELSFQGSFTFTRNNTHESSGSSSQLSLANYISALENALLVHPILRLSFLSAEILALDTENDNSNTTVHFGMKFNPRLLLGATLKDIVDALKQHLQMPDASVDKNSVSVREFFPSSAVTSPSILTESSSSSGHVIEDNLTSTAGRCVSAMQLPFCINITEKSYTAYPNLLLHKSKEDVTDNLIVFRELIDAECYEYAGEFLCSVLQPKCIQRPSLPTDETKLPCRAFCREFWAGCGDRLSDNLKKSLDCFKFPEYSDFGRKCRAQPNCDPVTLKNDEAFSYRLCDGVIDCKDLEDEMSCPYCTATDALHCGLNKKCIPQSNLCDDVSDCPDGSDEKNCLSLRPNVTADLHYKTVLDTPSYKEGYAVYTRNGTTANICVENDMDDTFSGPILNKIGESLCRNSAYQNVRRVETKSIKNTNLPSSSVFAKLQYKRNVDVSFSLSSNCSSNRLLHVTCTGIECGIQTTRNYISIEGLNKIAKAGDWPWHVALFKDGVHACDATLVSQHWLLTTISCFQGQNKAEWIAKLGTIRLYAKSPWQQERHIVGMIKSPVEGSTLVLIKLSSPVIFSHFIRPICLPSGNALADDLMYCNTLGWTKTREMLQRIEVRETAMDNCADISITSGNTLCAGSTFDPSECNEEEMAGSAMICLTSKQNRWILVGVSSWRISCTPIGMQRPRLYDKITSNVNWIQSVIQDV
ncbi:atrial natriuretic peptide-converting enzyme-like [Planococcus citri]|uniref:atrial natriuretic peptide-converting enzyme-like n=1 Tax=Planococcus citri TaxID=170843 RepID=UPI0031F8B818